MSVKNLELPSVSELVEKGNFFIPGYQRGYRWPEQQIKYLLDDIADFTPKAVDGSNEKTWYCLQPLVVKQCDKSTYSVNKLDPNEKWFEVIDGQQRLTTIFLVLTYFNQGYIPERRKKLFKLHYATREGSKALLEKNLNENIIDDSSIDFYYITTAYKTIHEWFLKKGDSFDRNNFESKFAFSTKVIWYESEETDSIAIFRRLNVGKIALTNAELIKALFLNRFNFHHSDPQKIRLKQLEIANEWDRIEYTLQDKELWYFLTEGREDMSTRIEFIFDLLSKKKADEDDEHFTFRYFSEKFNNQSEEEINKNWREIKDCFRVMEEWFSNRELYHKIGFLISTGSDIRNLLKLSSGLKKSEFIEKLNEEIKEKVKVRIIDLKYKDAAVKRVLLLHNIETMLNNSQEDSRFSFYRFKVEKWDIEHIHSVQEQMPKTDSHRKDWLKEASEFIKDDEHLKRRVETYNNTNFELLYREVLNYFNDKKAHEDINDISNLALLDSGTNRGYKNAVFPVKRKVILKKERMGTFVPLCTKNIFMKNFSQQVEQMTFWGEKDRVDYLDNLLEVLHKYLPDQS